MRVFLGSIGAAVQITAEGKIGIALALVGLLGTGAAMVAPNQMWIGWTSVSLAVSGGGALALHHIYPEFSERRGFVLVLIGICLIISGSVLGLVGAFQMDSKKDVGKAGVISPVQNEIPGGFGLFMDQSSNISVNRGSFRGSAGGMAIRRSDNVDIQDVDAEAGPHRK